MSEIEVEQTDSGVVNEYERQPVPENKTKSAGSFLGLFASEHVAATELLIGPLFLASGVSAYDLIVGLLVGNLLAVLTWRFITAPIAVKKRMTLYFQLEKIGGPAIISVYNFANGILWCCLGGAFIYVSATALFIPLDIAEPGLGDWMPTGLGMVAVILGVGAVIVIVATKGYDAVSRFANVAAPWMVLMFIVFGIATLPKLGINSVSEFWEVASNDIWKGGEPVAGQTKFTFFHVMCFAWFGNMAWHWGMGDLTIFRYAKKANYGFISAAGMYLGHYIAWITAGLLYAVQLKADPTNTSVVPGPMAYRVAGIGGILLVVLAGWTTANPVIYRAGLAFQAIIPKSSRGVITLLAGVVASIIAIFPGFCNNFLSVAMIYGLSLAPMGGVIFADHYLMKTFGMAEFYAEKKGEKVHPPALVAWIVSVALWIVLWKCYEIDLVYLCLPSWICAVVVYICLSKSVQNPGGITKSLVGITMALVNGAAKPGHIIRKILVLLSMLGLAIVLLSPIMELLGWPVIGKMLPEYDLCITGITVGGALWFVTAPFWMGRKKAVVEQS